MIYCIYLGDEVLSDAFQAICRCLLCNRCLDLHAVCCAAYRFVEERYMRGNVPLHLSLYSSAVLLCICGTLSGEYFVRHVPVGLDVV